jgi:uncharacterized protein YhfF
MIEKSEEVWRSLELFSFGDSPELADELAELVLGGEKRATCWAASDGPSTAVGKRVVMLDGAGASRAIIDTVELTRRRFDDLDEAFAFDEGENERTLASWRKAHRSDFGRHGLFAPDIAALLRTVPRHRADRPSARAGECIEARYRELKQEVEDLRELREIAGGAQLDVSHPSRGSRNSRTYTCPRCGNALEAIGGNPIWS